MVFLQLADVMVHESFTRSFLSGYSAFYRAKRIKVDFAAAREGQSFRQLGPMRGSFDRGNRLAEQEI